MLVVCDTSPLRALQALDRVDLIQSLYTAALIPPAVADELARSAPMLGPFPITAYPFLAIRAPRDVLRVASLLTTVDRGEAEAISLALETKPEALLIDDLAGRAAAERLGLPIMGVLGLLVRAKHAGKVRRVAPLIDELVRVLGFRIGPTVRSAILRSAGETVSE